MVYDTKPTIDAMRTLDTLVSRGLDTLEDALLLARRVAADVVDPIDCLDTWTDSSDPRPRVLVIGSGWGSHALVKVVDADLYRLLVVSPRNYFIFTPMLAASSVGTVEYRSITEPMRGSNPRAAFVQGTVEDIDPIERTADICIGTDGTDATGCHRVNYDICVYAAGVKASVSQVPGVEEHCYVLKELQDAQALRRAVAEALERASEPGLTVEERRRMLTLVVVGGGATGVEYCGELSDFLLDAVGKLYPNLLSLAQVILVHGGKEVLPQFDEPLRVQALNSLRARRVEVMLSTRVDRVHSPYKLTLKQRRPQGDSTAGLQSEVDWELSDLRCGLIMWAAGTGPTPLTKLVLKRLVDCNPELAEATDDKGAGVLGDDKAIWGAQWFASGSTADPSAVAMQRQDLGLGRITVDPWLRAVGAPSGTFIAIGDASLSYSARGAPLPQTAQVAAQQGAYVARLLNRGYDLCGNTPGDLASSELQGCELMGPPISREAQSGDLVKLAALRGALEAKPFTFLNLGLLAYLGGGEALSQVQVGESRLLAEAGSTGFLLWRSVYVVKQVSPRTRFLVLFDWLKTKVFGRDCTSW